MILLRLLIRIRIGYATSKELFEDNNILSEIKNIFENYEEYSLNAKRYIDENHSVKGVFDIIKEYLNL